MLISWLCCNPWRNRSVVKDVYDILRVVSQFSCSTLDTAYFKFPSPGNLREASTPQRQPSWRVFTPEKSRSPDNPQLTFQHRQQQAWRFKKHIRRNFLPKTNTEVSTEWQRGRQAPNRRQKRIKYNRSERDWYRVTYNKVRFSNTLVGATSF